MKLLLTWVGALVFAVAMGEVLFRLVVGFIDDCPLRREPGVVAGKAGAPPAPDVLHTNGIATTNLSPSGFVEIAGRRYPAQSRGEFVEARTPVTVIAIKPCAVVVRGIDASSPDARA